MLELVRKVFVAALELDFQHRLAAHAARFVVELFHANARVARLGAQHANALQFEGS